MSRMADEVCRPGVFLQDMSWNLSDKEDDEDEDDPFDLKSVTVNRTGHCPNPRTETLIQIEGDDPFLDSEEDWDRLKTEASALAALAAEPVGSMTPIKNYDWDRLGMEASVVADGIKYGDSLLSPKKPLISPATLDSSLSILISENLMLSSSPEAFIFNKSSSCLSTNTDFSSSLYQNSKPFKNPGKSPPRMAVSLKENFKPPHLLSSEGQKIFRSSRNPLTPSNKTSLNPSSEVKLPNPKVRMTFPPKRIVKPLLKREAPLKSRKVTLPLKAKPPLSGSISVPQKRETSNSSLKKSETRRSVSNASQNKSKSLKSLHGNADTYIPSSSPTSRKSVTLPRKNAGYKGKPLNTTPIATRSASHRFDGPVVSSTPAEKRGKSANALGVNAALPSPILKYQRRNGKPSVA